MYMPFKYPLGRIFLKVLVQPPRIAMVKKQQLHPSNFDRGKCNKKQGELKIPNDAPDSAYLSRGLVLRF